MGDRTLARMLPAEFVGAFALVFAGCGAVTVERRSGWRGERVATEIRIG
jgi:glycerol uptake facilitator-like aquaporin